MYQGKLVDSNLFNTKLYIFIIIIFQMFSCQLFVCEETLRARPCKDTCALCPHRGMY